MRKVFFNAALLTAILLLYAIMSFVTYGYVTARRDMPQPDSVLVSVAWPLYWGGRALIAIVDGAADISVRAFTEHPSPAVER